MTTHGAGTTVLLFSFTNNQNICKLFISPEMCFYKDEKNKPRQTNILLTILMPLCGKSIVNVICSLQNQTQGNKLQDM